MHTRHKHTTYAWRNIHTSHTRAPTAPRVTIQTENTTSITFLHKHTIYFNTQMLKQYLQNRPLHNKLPTYPHTVTTTDIKTNMRHIHIFIVSRYLATRGNNKILRTSPPRLTHRTLRPIHITNKLLTFSNHTYTTSTTNPIHHHYAPSFLLTYTTYIISSTTTTYAPRCHPWIYGQTPPMWLHC